MPEKRVPVCSCFRTVHSCIFWFFPALLTNRHTLNFCTLQDVFSSASSPILESMPTNVLSLSNKISYWSLFTRILESHRMTCSPRITISMEHPLRLRHGPLPTFCSRFRELVISRQTLSLATLRASGLTRFTDSPWPNLGLLPTSSATKSSSTTSLSKVSS